LFFLIYNSRKYNLFVCKITDQSLFVVVRGQESLNLLTAMIPSREVPIDYWYKAKLEDVVTAVCTEIDEKTNRTICSIVRAKGLVKGPVTPQAEAPATPAPVAAAPAPPPAPVSTPGPTSVASARTMRARMFENMTKNKR